MEAFDGVVEQEGGVMHAAKCAYIERLDPKSLTKLNYFELIFCTTALVALMLEEPLEEMDANFANYQNDWHYRWTRGEFDRLAAECEVELPWASIVKGVKEYTQLVGLVRMFGMGHTCMKRAHTFFRTCKNFEEGMERVRKKAAACDENVSKEKRGSEAVEESVCKLFHNEIAFDQLMGQTMKKRKVKHDSVANELTEEEKKRLQWPDLSEEDGGGKCAVNRELLDNANVIRVDSHGFDEWNESMMRTAKVFTDEAKRNEKRKKEGKPQKWTKWQDSKWTKDELLKNENVEVVDVLTIVIFGYFILVLYVPSDEPLNHLDALALRVDVLSELDGHPDVFSRRGFTTITRGISKRGSGIMYMGGSHSARTKAGVKKERREYASAEDEDEELSRLLEEYVTKEALKHEQRDVPAISNARNGVVKGSDPWGLYSIISKDEATRTNAVSVTDTYVVSPHQDKGAYRGVTESILLSSKGIRLPKGHEWNFAAGMTIFRLDVHKSCRIYVPSLVWHGTLPTSCKEDTYYHRGVGSALVLKNDMVQIGMRFAPSR